MNQSPKAFFLIGFVSIVAFLFLFGLGNALMPLLIAFCLAYLSFPLIRKLEKKGILRSHAVMGVLSSLAAVLILALLLGVPPLIKDARQFFQELPQTSTVAIEKVESLSNKFGYPIDISKQGLKEFLVEHTSIVSSEFVKMSSNFLKGLLSNFIGGLLFILNLLLLPLFFFHLVNRYEEISKEATEIVPIAWRPKVNRIIRLTNSILSGYVRGQLLVAVILSVLYGIGFYSIGLRFGMLIGMATGLLSFIPFVGSLLGFVAAMLVALANFSGIGIVLGVAIVFCVVQGIEGFLLTPKLVGNRVGLGILSTMLALIIGGNLLGFSGMIVAIPLAAVLKVILCDLKAEYKTLKIYKGN